MEALILSFGIITANEMGDKTQILAMCLASQFRKPVPVLLGIFAATLLSNLVAGLLGQWAGSLLVGNLLHIILGISFLAAAIWALIPEKTEECPTIVSSHGIFITSFICFFLAEMGDKTQLAAVVLAARFHSYAAVVTGTTLGMMAANLPVVLFSHKMMEKVPLKLVKTASAAVFTVLGLYELSHLF